MEVVYTPLVSPQSSCSHWGLVLGNQPSRDYFLQKLASLHFQGYHKLHFLLWHKSLERYVIYAEYTYYGANIT